MRAGDWDREAGSPQRERQQRAVDARTTVRVPPSPVAPLWQPFPNEQYADGPNNAHLVDVLEKTLRNADWPMSCYEMVSGDVVALLEPK
jgi:hypothetical protein